MRYRERALLKRVRAGERAACGQLIDRHYGPVYRYLLGMSGNAEVAADLCQGTFARAWEAIGGFAGRSALRTWLITIARNEFFSYLRKAGRTREWADALDLASVPDPRPSVAENHQHAQVGKALRQLVDGLPAKSREIVCLHYFSELSLRQSAALLSLPLGTAKSRLNTALSLLRTKVEEETRHEETRDHSTTAQA